MSVRRAIGLGLGVALGVFLPGGAARALDKAQCAAAAEEAQALRDAGKLGLSREKLLTCAQQGCPAVVRDDCARWLGEVDARRPSLVFGARDPRGSDLTDVRVSADGRPLADRLDGSAVSVDPGQLHLRFESAGLPPVERTIVVLEGQKSRLVEVVMGGAPPASGPVAAPPGRAAPRLPGAAPGERRASAALAAPGERGVSAAPWISLGVGAAGIAAFGVLQGLAQAEYADLEDGCGRTSSCTEAEVSPTRTKFVASGVMLGVGGAALAVAAVLWLVDGSVEPAAAGLRVSAGVGPGGGFVRLAVPLGL
ncbi:hypothetical protein [Sorangium sp. So ce1151]|uniref:hypothetical protein n=1 Tax=Sorangium sp. So ce1151 TaxID=3133332 RepID=UPI003F61CAAA